MDIFVITEVDVYPTLLYVMDIHHVMIDMMKVTVVSDMYLWFDFFIRTLLR